MPRAPRGDDRRPDRARANRREESLLRIPYLPGILGPAPRGTRGGRVFSVQSVKQELPGRGGDLSAWVEALPDSSCLPVSAADMPSLTAVGAPVTTMGHKPAAIDDFLAVADFYSHRTGQRSGAHRRGTRGIRPARGECQDPERLHPAQCGVHDAVRHGPSGARQIRHRDTRTLLSAPHDKGSVAVTTAPRATLLVGQSPDNPRPRLPAGRSSYARPARWCHSLTALSRSHAGSSSPSGMRHGTGTRRGAAILTSPGPAENSRET